MAEVGWAVLDMQEVKVAAWWKVQRWWRKDARNEVRERWELQETVCEKKHRETEALQWEIQVEVQLRFAQLLAVQSILQKLHVTILEFSCCTAGWSQHNRGSSSSKRRSSNSMSSSRPA